MDKTAAKSFALKARAELTNLVIIQAANLGITAEGIQKGKPLDDGIIVNGQVFGPEMAKAYEHLVRRIEISGYHEIMKEAIYTWFNRFVALRFMEVHDYLPIQMRIFSSLTPGKKEPDAVTEVGQLIEELELNRDLVYQMQDAHNTEQLFKYVVEKQGRQLEEIIPQVFQEVERDFYLLLPDGLLREDGFIDQLVNMIPEEDWQEIEIIGWLYQYYISEEKDEIFANLSKNKIGKDEIGAATQIFTPKWIVQYLVGNSLGRLWLEDYPQSNLKQHLPYYVEDAEQPQEVLEQLEALKGTPINPEEIKVMDPSMGSGHMLLEAFEIMRQIYLEQGYRPREIPALILGKNIYGLDIDKRASQLASFALVMKARQYDRRFFERNVKLNLVGFEESNGMPTFQNIELVNLEEINLELEKLYLNFRDAKLYGSIIKLNPVNIAIIEEAIKDIKSRSINDIFAREYLDYEIPYIEHLIHQYQLLSQKYHVTVTNPPYMGSGGMSAPLSKYVKKHYPMSKADLFAVFMEVEFSLTKENYYSAMINQQSWMFLKSYEKIRKYILDNKTIISMNHTGTRSFPEIGGEVVQSVSYILKSKSLDKYISNYIRLVNISSESKHKDFFDIKNKFNIRQCEFSKIPGSPLAYWISKNLIKNFTKNNVGSYLITREGMATANNDLFLRFWHEIINKKHFLEDFQDSKWVAYNKGGSYRKWYGNNYYVVNWENDGYGIKNNIDSQTKRIRSHNYNGEYAFREGLSWSSLSTGNISFRYSPKGFLFDSKGAMGFSKKDTNIKVIQSFLNSKIAMKYLEFISPTMDFKVGDIVQIPYLLNDISNKEIMLLEAICNENVNISKKDWDFFETSWDFNKHPFITYKENNKNLENSFDNWKKETMKNFNQLKSNEEELNRIFIDIYGLQDELTSEVEDKDVTIRKADLERDVKSFLSYLVGIIFGRYSLDEPGLIYAGGGFDRSRYKRYQPDNDNIIPLTHENYFQDDILTRITELVELIYGAETLEENLLFIAEALKMKGDETPRDTIRRYFMKDFFKDHKKIYQNRPIYWQMTSGKQDAFKSIFYLHRYDEATLARVRTEYVLPLTNTLTELSNQMQAVVDGSASSREVASARKQMEKYQKQLQELRDYDLILKNLADQHIALDLDDGVLVNYDKFQSIPVTNTHTGKPGKMNLLEKLK